MKFTRLVILEGTAWSHVNQNAVAFGEYFLEIQVIVLIKRLHSGGGVEWFC